MRFQPHSSGDESVNIFPWVAFGYDLLLMYQEVRIDVYLEVQDT